MNHLANIGTNFYAYLPLVAVLFLAVVVYFIAKTGWKLAKLEDTVEDIAARAQLSKTYIRQMVMLSIAVIFLIFAIFYAYGPGHMMKTSSYQKSGWMERVKELPNEQPQALITQEGNELKDKTGTLPKVATEEEYQKSKEDADKEIDSILKRKP